MFGDMFQNGLWNPWGQNFQNPWQQNNFGGFGGFNPFAPQGGGMDAMNPFQGLDFGALLGTQAPAPVLPPDIDPNARPRTADEMRAERLSMTPEKAQRLRQRKVRERLTDPQVGGWGRN